MFFFSDLSNDHNQPSSGESGGGDSDTESRGGKGSSNKKRGLFPKQATNILRAWLFQNLSVSITTCAFKIDQNTYNLKPESKTRVRGSKKVEIP